MSNDGVNILGKYEIIREIGRSNDIVYEAIDPTIGRRIALKELLMPDNAQGSQRRDRIERFRREGRAAGRLAHPNIVTVYEVGVENDRYFIAMELLDGQNLRDALKARGMLPVNDAVNYTIQLCDALSYAHKQGVIHRDIKPDNVQILPGNHIKLTDFGIARVAGETNLTQDGQIFGTPSYMSPEQISGKPLDTRSDTFSVGVLLYEMVTGQKPFTGDGVVAITYAIMNSEPVFPPGIPPYIASAIKKALSKNPEDRYSEIEQMANDLREQKVDSPQPQQQGIYGGTSSPSPYQPQYPPASPAPAQQAQPPSGKYIPSSPGWTPYGTPISNYDPTPPPTSGTPLQTDYRATVPPPIISAPTRSFLGLLMLILGLVGLAAFFGWALSRVYSNYKIQHSGEAATRYFDQGKKLFAENNYEGAIKQWQLVMETDPGSRMSMTADEYIFRATVKLGDQSIQNNDFKNLAIIAQRLMYLRKTSPEGYFFMGICFEQNQQYTKAEEYFGKATRFNAGGDSQPYVDMANQKLKEYIPNYNPPPADSAPPYVPPPGP